MQDFNFSSGAWTSNINTGAETESGAETGPCAEEFGHAALTTMTGVEKGPVSVALVSLRATTCSQEAHTWDMMEALCSFCINHSLHLPAGMSIASWKSSCVSTLQMKPSWERFSLRPTAKEKK